MRILQKQTVCQWAITPCTLAGGMGCGASAPAGAQQQPEVQQQPKLVQQQPVSPDRAILVKVGHHLGPPCMSNGALGK